MRSIRIWASAGILFLLAACSTTPPVPPSTATAAAVESNPDEDVLDRSLANGTAAKERYSIGGLPIATEPMVVLENTGYVVGYSEEKIDPLWAAYYCGPQVLFTNEKRPARFSRDDRVCPSARLKHEDYNRPPGSTSTYDRGHMAPNYAIATRYGRTAQLETFLLTNVAPQRSSLNQRTWRALEAEIARNFAPACEGVWVVVGPVFRDPVTRYNGKPALPAAFFCIVLDRTEAGAFRGLALVMDQSVTGKRRMGDFITTIRDIEAQAGINFFAGLPDAVEEQLETAKADSDWNWDLVLDPDKFLGDD